MPFEDRLVSLAAVCKVLFLEELGGNLKGLTSPHSSGQMASSQETSPATAPAKPGINVADLLGPDLLIKQDGAIGKGSLSDLDGKYVLLYFSAHWCPPCRAFTPILKQTYATLRAQGKPLEVVFVSSDSSKAEFEVSCLAPVEKQRRSPSC